MSKQSTCPKCKKDRSHVVMHWEGDTRCGVCGKINGKRGPEGCTRVHADMISDAEVERLMSLWAARRRAGV